MVGRFDHSDLRIAFSNGWTYVYADDLVGGMPYMNPGVAAKPGDVPPIMAGMNYILKIQNERYAKNKQAEVQANYHQLESINAR